MVQTLKNILSFFLIFLLCSGCSSKADSSASPLQSQSAAQSSAATATTTLTAGSTAPSASRSAAASKSASPAPAPASEPQAYTVAWLDKYAPGSVASFEEQVGDNGDSEPASYPSADTYKLVVDLTNQCVYAYTKGLDGAYSKLARVMLCTTGNEENKTGGGTYKLGKDRKRFGLFNDFDCYAQYWTQIVGEIYFHSILYYKQDAKTLIKSSYNNLGKPVSHGCIRLFVPDARWIYQNCAPGTVCELTSEIKKNEQLQSALKKGHAGAVDYAPPPK